MSSATPQRAIGIVRQSNERDGSESPDEQADRIRAEAARLGCELLYVDTQEVDVSGRNELDRRPGLMRALRDIEDGAAEVLLFAYFDRSFRNLRVQGEVIERIERAGGRVRAVDVGEVSNGSAGQWLSSTLLGAVSEYVARSTGERARAAVVRRVAEGVVPYKVRTLGLGVDEHGRVVADDHVVLDHVEEALRMRADGATIPEVRAFLRGHGHELSHKRVRCLLRDRLLVGEIHAGALVNLTAAEPFVDRVLFERVQARVVPRGPRPTSDLLLARLGILRCATCGARMTASAQTQKGIRYPGYRCPVNLDCPRRVAIMASIVDEEVLRATEAELAAVEGGASTESNARAARAEAGRAQDELDALIGALRSTGLLGEPAAVAELEAARVARDAAEERARQLEALTARRVVGAADLRSATLAEQREAIRVTIARVTVTPAVDGRRGADRLSIELFGE